jgi:hypothetical protein
MSVLGDLFSRNLFGSNVIRSTGVLVSYKDDVFCNVLPSQVDSTNSSLTTIDKMAHSNK